MKKKQIFCGVLGLLIVSSLAACNSQATPPNESTSPLPAVVGNEELNGSYENESASGDNVEVTAAGIAQTYVIQDNTPQTPVSYSQYEAFGLQYDESKNELYFDGELVRYFYDGVKLSDGAANGGTFSFHSADGGKINVRMVYDADGNLTGVKQTN